MMAETAQSLLDRIEAAAAVLEDTNVVDLVSAVRSALADPLLHLLVVGTPGSGRSALVNALIDRPGLLPSTPLPKRAVPIILDFADTAAVDAETSQGLSSRLAPDRLRSLLIDDGMVPSLISGTLSRIKVTEPAEVLRTVQIRVETLDDRAAGDWKPVLAASDFVLVVLRAHALLSDAESRFLRDVLLPLAGPQRCAVVVNQMDRVPEEELSTLRERIRAFFAGLPVEPAVIEISAAGSPDVEGLGALRKLVSEDLAVQPGQGKTESAKRALTACIDSLEDSARRRSESLAVTTGELNGLLEALRTSDEWLRQRRTAAEDRIGAFVSVALQDRLLREVESFGSAFGEQLQNEIMSSPDLPALRRHLAGFIESTWSYFLEGQLAMMRADIQEELIAIAEQAQTDLETVAGAQAAELARLMEGLDGTATARAFWMPRRAKHDPSTFATAIQFGGLFMLVLPGLQVLGIAAIGAGQVIRIVTRRDAETADREAVVRSVVDGWPDVVKQVRREIETQLATAATALRQAAGSLFDETVQRAQRALEETARQHGDLALREADIQRVHTETIPSLRSRLESLFGEAAAV